jgi:hypothetical protein
VLSPARALEPFAFGDLAGAFAEVVLALAVLFLPEDFGGEPEPDFGAPAAAFRARDVVPVGLRVCPGLESSFPRGFLPVGPG